MFPFPVLDTQIGGHEGVGHVVKFGPGTDTSGLKLGDRVGVKWLSSVCGNCPPCLATADGLCFNQKVSGYYTPGTFQQYVVGPANYVTPIPDELSSTDAAPMLCAGLTVYSALRKCKAHPGDYVVIAGSGGGLGHLACQIGAKGFGYRIIGIDMGAKEKISIESGAEHFVNLSKFFPPRSKEPTAEESKFDPAAASQALVDHVKSLTGGLGAHAVIVCTAANGAFAQGADFLRFNGTLVCVGLPEGEYQAIATATPAAFITRQISICGSAVGNRQEAIETLAFAARGIVKVHSKTEKMENLTKIMQELDRGEVEGRYVLDLS